MSNWISVDERLPDDGANVLAIWWAGEMCISHHLDTGWWYLSKRGLMQAFVNPTHGMPLPEPPEATDE